MPRTCFIQHVRGYVVSTSLHLCGARRDSGLQVGWRSCLKQHNLIVWGSLDRGDIGVPFAWKTRYERPRLRHVDCGFLWRSGFFVKDGVNIRMVANTTLGVRRQIRQCDFATLTHTVYPPFHNLESHVHELGCFGLTLGGLFTESFGPYKLERAPQMVFYRPLGEPHSNSTGECGAKCFVVEYPSSWVADISRFGRLPDAPRLLQPSRQTRIMQDIYREFHNCDGASCLAIQSLVLEMTASLIRETSGTEPRSAPLWLTTVKEMLDDSFSQSLTVTRLAQEAGVHAAHLAREFRRHYAMPIGEYVRRKRIAGAVAEIERGDKSLAEIALWAGFCNQGHFCTVFKRTTGRTPSEYRASTVKRV
jgi:AraC family transcriptional regulator